MKRVVVDPNVLLSAFVGNPQAAPTILLEAIHEHAIEIIACPTLIAEIRDNLTEPYFCALIDEQEAARAVRHTSISSGGKVRTRPPSLPFFTPHSPHHLGRGISDLLPPDYESWRIAAGSLTRSEKRFSRRF